MKDDLISRQAAIDAADSETVSTNPEHFKSSEKFIKFMDDDDIASFGRWQWANGFNTALVASKVQLEKLPSAQPEPCEDTISRQDAINLIERYCDNGCEIAEDKWCPDCQQSKFAEMIKALPSAQPEIVRCEDCRHNHDCNIQYHAQAGEEFYCGCAELKGEQP